MTAIEVAKEALEAIASGNRTAHECVEWARQALRTIADTEKKGEGEEMNISTILDIKHTQEEILKTQSYYIRLLEDEIKDLVTIAAVHGWKSHRQKQGELCREEIDGLRLSLHKLSKNV